MNTRTVGRRTILWGMALAVLGAVALGPAWAGHRGPGRHPGPEARMERLAERLGLSDEQKAQMKALWEQHREALRPLMERRRELRGRLDELVRAETPDEDAIRRTAEELGRLEGELALLRVRHRQDLSRILTPEQLAQMDELHERRRHRRAERFRRGDL